MGILILILIQWRGHQEQMRIERRKKERKKKEKRTTKTNNQTNKLL